MRRFAFALLVIAALGMPAGANEEKTFTLTVTAAELTTLGNALGQRPYVDVAALIAKLQMQVAQQNAPKPSPDTPKDK